ncbi:MAG: hypothetical protein IH845_04545 [Nanoarchaeota archaeon]|nr:hypothetical protein [Nanoarchaeota archaeon]
MKVVDLIKDLEKRNIISREPHPAVLFILSFIMVILAFVSSNVEGAKIIEMPLYFLAGFGFIFAIGHLAVVWVLEK